MKVQLDMMFIFISLQLKFKTVMSSKSMENMRKKFSMFDNDIQFSAGHSLELIGKETHMSFLECVQDCLRTVGCKSVRYNLPFLICELNKESIDQSSFILGESDYTYMYENVKAWEKIFRTDDICGKTECNINEKCRKRNGIYTCAVASKNTNVEGIRQFHCATPPELGNGSIVMSEGTRIYSSVTYTCLQGFRLKGKSRAVCLENGQWSSASHFPYCEQVQCQQPNPVSNAKFELLNETTFFGDVARYSCLEVGVCEGRMISSNVDEDTVTCMMNGQWSDLNLECLKEIIQWNCETSNIEIKVACIVDNTCSITDDKFDDQTDFFQRLAMSLSNITPCPRVALYKHDDRSHTIFGFEATSSPNETCSRIGEITHECRVGHSDLDVVLAAIQGFNGFQPGVIIHISDDTGLTWNSKTALSVFEEARTAGITIITIIERGTVTATAPNHRNFNIESMADLTSHINDCLEILKSFIITSTHG